MITKEIEVQVLGKNFNFNLPGNIRTEDFLEIIDYVENKFKKIKNETQDLDSFKLGLLASINITEEFFSLKREHRQLRELLGRIDKMVSPEDIDEGEQLPISFSS
ncbi:MAG: cell division protein ZapA [bacterium]|nr:cell division protein ZapA [bacterium]